MRAGRCILGIILLAILIIAVGGIYAFAEIPTVNNAGAVYADYASSNFTPMNGDMSSVLILMLCTAGFLLITLILIGIKMKK